MKAYRFTAFLTKPEIVDIPVPEPGPGEVLIKVGGAGVCHSDLHILEWTEEQSPIKPPFTFGHENAGWVEKLGGGVQGLAVGDAVAVYGPWGCGHCARCRTGQENYCERQKEIKGYGGGLGLDGGMAEYMLIPSARFLVPLGDMDPRDAAPLTDAGLTPYHAIKRTLPRLGTGSTAVVIGVGGLGHTGVQILRALSPAHIIAVDKDKEKLILAEQSGADHVVLAGDEAVEEILALTNGQGADAVFDFVGAESTMALAAKVGRPLGTITVVGIAGGTFPFSFFAVPYECELTTTYWGSVTELMEVIELGKSGKIKIHAERFGMDRIDEAYDRLRHGTLDGRAVITPNG